jgi:hypothetical protein
VSTRTRAKKSRRFDAGGFRSIDSSRESKPISGLTR